ncbi:MAG: YhcN/YlaJ family sporulation lipoprotein [Bacilli bacterium]
MNRILRFSLVVMMSVLVGGCSENIQPKKQSEINNPMYYNTSEHAIQNAIQLPLKYEGTSNESLLAAQIKKTILKNKEIKDCIVLVTDSEVFVAMISDVENSKQREIQQTYKKHLEQHFSGKDVRVGVGKSLVTDLPTILKDMNNGTPIGFSKEMLNDYMKDFWDTISNVVTKY